MKVDKGIVIGSISLILISIIILRSVAPGVFPLYFVYLVLAGLAFVFFAQIEFAVISAFYWYFYVGSIIFLILPLIIGQVTRGAVRWIPVGSLTIQPAEIVRPFLIVFFAKFLTLKRTDLTHFIKSLVLLSLPAILILVQPSLGVAMMTVAGFVGVVLSSDFDKRVLILAVLLIGFSGPLLWNIMAPYQKQRIFSFISPYSDPGGAGYNSIQSMISVGSGKIWGRGLGEGVQTQLAFLPERHTDFIFAAVAEEMGFVGAVLVLGLEFFVLSRIVSAIKTAKSPEARAFVSGIFLTLFVQTLVHIGMNMGLFPITGVPLPLVSAGGSSLVATMMALGMIIGVRK